MHFRSRGPGPPASYAHYPVVLLRLVLFTFTLFHLISVQAAPNKYFEVSSLCKTQFLQSSYQQVDGAVVLSKNERNLDCVLTFQSLSVLQKLILRFDRLNLDCNDHLYVYDVANAVGPYKFDLTCKNTIDDFGVMFTSSNSVTLRYVTDAWGTEVNGFELLMTAYRNETEESCKGFRCSYKKHCISKDLVCDGLNHCLDGSDESLSCFNGENVLVFGMNMPTLIVIIASIGLFTVVFLVALISCLCRRSSSSAAANHRVMPPTSNTYATSGIGLSTSNGSGVLLAADGGPSLAIATGSGGKRSVNWRHPAGSMLGYSNEVPRLLLQLLLLPLLHSCQTN